MRCTTAPDRGCSFPASAPEVTTAFDELDSLASGAVTAMFGEEATLTPRRGSQYTELAADPDSPPVSIRGVFSATAATADLKGQGRSAEFKGTTRLLAEQSSFWIAAEQAAAIGFRPAKGDLLQLSDRPGASSFSIVAVHPTSLGDLNLLLVLEDQAI
jgi:hypothetical protein